MDTTSADATFIQEVMEFFRTSTFGVLEIVIIVVFGFLIVKMLMKLVKQALLSSRIDRSLISFASAVVKFVMLLILTLYCLNRMNVNVTGVLALVSAVGLAIGLALQDLVGGIANGLVIINTKPFKVDDYVTIGSYSGTVREISLLHTVLVTPDNKKIILTNKSVYNSEITNFSAYANRRLDLSFDIDYSESVENAKAVIRRVVEAHPMVLSDPAPFIRLTGEEDSALVITVRVWVKAENFWDLNFDLKEQIYDALSKEGIDIPFPQLTVGFRGDDKMLQDFLKARQARKADENSGRDK